MKGFLRQSTEDGSTVKAMNKKDEKKEGERKMKVMEVFFDYLCPYCFQGHQNLKKALVVVPDVEIVWRPCEAHPRPERSDIYSDRAIQGMYLVEKLGGNLWDYHDAVYFAVFEQRLRIDRIEVLSRCAKQAGVDEIKFQEWMRQGKEYDRVQKGNQYAWNEMAWEAVPSYQKGGKTLGSKNGRLVPLKDLEQFLASE